MSKVERRTDPDHDTVTQCEAPHQVVVAPPGTGKTHVAVRLAGALTAELAPHERVLLLTFSRQARAQLEGEAARQLASAQRARIEVTNYHRLCWQAVMSYKRALGLPEALDIGSGRRRRDALKTASQQGAALLEGKSGLAESLAEHMFERFRDDRTPSDELLGPLLAAVAAELRAGRLVFDDFGALFWRLLEENTTVRKAYLARYPIVIADEHQDASALQDAIVRRLGTRRLVVLADHMQLIHGYRGADIRRLRAHWRDSQVQHTLRTPHRWSQHPASGAWLLALRQQLAGESATAPRPEAVVVSTYKAAHGTNGALAPLKWTVPKLFPAGMRSVAVLVRDNRDLGRVRNYLANNGMRPRQIGGSKDFEEARADIEQLPLFTDGQSLALHALDRLTALVPTLPRNVADQIRRRLQPAGPNLAGARRPAADMLAVSAELFDDGPNAYFRVMDALLVICGDCGYHLPRPEAIRAIRQTAAALTADDGIEDGLLRYGQHVAASLHHVPPRADRGLFLMTAHQAKGKEFDAVVLFAVDARRWPDDEDHRRLLYVALTRATRSWTIVAPDTASSPLLGAVP